MIDRPQVASTIATVAEFDKVYCVYEHYLMDINAQTTTLMYVGYCRLRDVYLFPDARKNTEWQRIFTQDALLVVNVIMTSDTLHNCQRKVSELYKTMRPHCNVNGRTSFGKTMVYCIETGEEFESVLAAARAKGLSQSQLNNHINGQSGFKSVKGLTFRRGFNPARPQRHVLPPESERGWPTLTPDHNATMRQGLLQDPPQPGYAPAAAMTSARNVLPPESQRPGYIAPDEPSSVPWKYADET